MQTANAFGQVQSALSFFVNVYRNIAEWRAVIERLARLRCIGGGRARGCGDAAGDRSRHAGQRERRLASNDLAVRLPNGVPLVNANDMSIGSGERVLVSGPSGAGKSTLFRALAGVWPFGAGTHHGAEEARG